MVHNDMINITTNVNGKEKVTMFPGARDIPEDPMLTIKGFGQQFTLRQVLAKQKAKDKLPDELTSEEQFAICMLGGAEFKISLRHDPETHADVVDAKLIGEYTIEKDESGFVVTRTDTDHSQPNSPPIDDLPQHPS